MRPKIISGHILQKIQVYIPLHIRPGVNTLNTGTEVTMVAGTLLLLRTAVRLGLYCMMGPMSQN